MAQRRPRRERLRWRHEPPPLAHGVVMTFILLSRDIEGQLYEKCGLCPLFIFENSAYGDAENLAEYIHSARGDAADERYEDHDATPSGFIATLNTWRVFGPSEMRERFVYFGHEPA